MCDEVDAMDIISHITAHSPSPLNSELVPACGSDPSRGGKEERRREKEGIKEVKKNSEHRRCFAAKRREESISSGLCECV